MSGKAGEDTNIRVPVGTAVTNVATEELIGDLTEHGQQLLVAHGGHGGQGNVALQEFGQPRAAQARCQAARARSARSRWSCAYWPTSACSGFPNAGKSTFIRAVSAATPRVADYPFTTLQPHLGVVSVETHRSFVIADIPGLIEGAADGAGLGIQFLRHIQRTGCCCIWWI